MRPRTSPSGSPRRTTSSPSSRNVRSLPSPSVERLGCPFQRQLDQAALAAALAAGDRPRRPSGRRCGRSRRSRSRARAAAASSSRAPRAFPRETTSPFSSTSSGRSRAQSPLDAQVRQRLRILRRRRHAAVFEQRERRHPGRDRRGEALAEERPERHVLPGLDVAGAPVVDEHDAEDVVGERARRRPARRGGWAPRRRSRARARCRADETGRTPGRRRPAAWPGPAAAGPACR